MLDYSSSRGWRPLLTTWYIRHASNILGESCNRDLIARKRDAFLLGPEKHTRVWFQRMFQQWAKHPAAGVVLWKTNQCTGTANRIWLSSFMLWNRLHYNILPDRAKLYVFCSWVQFWVPLINLDKHKEAIVTARSENPCYLLLRV